MKLATTKAKILGATAAFYSVTAFSAVPPNTLNLSDMDVVTQDALSAVGMSPAPYQFKEQVVLSPQSMIEQQVRQRESTQLSEAQINRLKELELSRQRANMTPYINTPNPIVRSVVPDLSPGKTPPIIRVSKDMLTSVVFTDMQGNPWYIDRVMLNSSQFSDSANSSTQSPTNILTLEPTSAIEYGNVTVILKGHDLPIIFLVSAGQGEVDIRLDAKIKGDNPNKPAVVADAQIPSIPVDDPLTSPQLDATAMRFMDGFIPPEAIPLKSSDAAVVAWNYNNAMYVKSRLDVLFPSYQGKASTSNGINIFRFDKQPHSITFMQRNGQPVTSSFSEKEAVLDINQYR